MGDEIIKIYTKEQLNKMSKNFLIERILLLENQLKIRSEREKNFNKVIHLTLDMLKLDHSSLAALYGKYQFELATDDPELMQRLVNNSARFEEIRQYIVNNHCMKDDGLISGTIYFDSEWLDEGGSK